MRVDDDMPYTEIAAALGISAVAAKVKVHRARLKLAEARVAGASPAAPKEKKPMNVTRDVVKDLLVVYLAGEASADTRTLVEDYLQIDEGLAREVEAARAAPLGAAAAPDLAPNSEKTALDATRKLLKERTSTLVIAVLFTALPLAFVVEGSHLSFVLIRDAPIVGLAWWLTAAVMWVWHARVRRRLRVSGL